MWPDTLRGSDSVSPVVGAWYGWPVDEPELADTVWVMFREVNGGGDWLAMLANFPPGGQPDSAFCNDPWAWYACPLISVYWTGFTHRGSGGWYGWYDKEYGENKATFMNGYMSEDQQELTITYLHDKKYLKNEANEHKVLHGRPRSREVSKWIGRRLDY